MEARHNKGWTQRELATHLKKSPSFIAKVELGERRLDVLEFIAFCRALDLRPGDELARVDAGLPSDFEI